MDMVQMIDLDAIRESKTNPAARTRAGMDDLIASVRAHGVLQPVLVRQVDNGASGPKYELVAGHRRVTAARAVGLKSVMAMIRTLTNTEALELQLVENLQRADLHPLEEAEGYRQLASQPGYDVAKIAARVGRSGGYVCDRLKLMALTKDAKKLFREDRFTAGHAILLARLKHADQERALAVESQAVFEHERSLFSIDEDPDGEREYVERLKCRSLRELREWIDRNVRFDPEAEDVPDLFPATAMVLRGAQKVIAITHLNYIPEHARDGKTIGPRSWKRADGGSKARSCEHAVTGFVAVGPHRGEAFLVCTAKESCATHWGKEIRERKERAASRVAAPATPTPAPAAKPQPREDPKLRSAVDAAHDEAEKEIRKLLMEAAVKTSPENLLRIAIATNPWPARPWLQDLGLKISSAKTIADWARTAKADQLKQAFADSLQDEGDGVPEAFGIDVDAIFKQHEKKAREAFKAPKPAPVKKVAGKKKRGAK